VLADCLTGYAVWAVASAIIKAVAVLFFTNKKGKVICTKNIIALIPAWIACVGGYYLYEAIISSNFVSPVAGILPNVIQCVFSTVVFLIAGLSIDKLKK
jgi:uncharacterized membrane protein